MMMTISKHCVMFSGRQDSSTLDGTRSDRLSQVYVVIGRLEFRCCYVGDFVVRRAAILELDKPGRHIGCW